MSLSRILLLLGVALALLSGIIWLTLPTVGVAGVAVTQVPVLNHVLNQMGVDSRIIQALTYVLWAVMGLTAHHCLSRKKHTFSRFTLVSTGTVAVAYLAWYANDRWLAGLKPLDLADPAIQAQAFDAYTGAPNLAATTTLDGSEHIYWHYVKTDPLSGLPTHPLEAAEFKKLLLVRIDADQQRAEQQRQEEEKAHQAHQAQLAQLAQLAQQATEAADLQSKNEALQQAARDAEAQRAALEQSQTQSNPAQKDQQLTDLQAKVQKLQQSLETEQAQREATPSNSPRALAVDPAHRAPAPVPAPEATEPAQAPADSSQPTGPIAQASGTLLPGQWFKVRLTSDHTYFWSNGPFEFGIPPQGTKKAPQGHLHVHGKTGVVALIRPLSPAATTIWSRDLVGN